jgi:hypothetical protein
LEISRTVLLVKVSELILRSCLRLLLVVLLLLLARRMARVYCPRRNGRPLREREVVVERCDSDYE